MRATVKLELSAHGLTHSDRADLVLKFVNDLPMSPPLDDHHPEVAKRRAALLSELPPNERAYVEETDLRTIHHASSGTWGVVSEASIGTLDMRLSNPVSERLKQACEALVMDCERTRPPALKLRFGVIQLLEGATEIPVYLGEALAHRRLRQAARDQKFEILLSASMLSLSLLLFYLTSPLSLGLSLVPGGPLWIQWFHINASSLATGVFAAGLVSGIKVALHWLDLRRHAAIRWTIAPVA